jgi:hypothetical protein
MPRTARSISIPLPTRRRALTPYKILGAKIRAVTEQITATKAAKELYGRDADFDEVLRAASAPALLNDSGSGWAGPLGRYGVSQEVEDIVAMSALGRLLAFGALRVDLGRLASVTIPERQTSAANAGAWIVEGAPVPVKQYSLLGPKLSPHKLECITTITWEMSNASNIEEILRTLLTEAAGLAIDAAVLSTAAATTAQPAGLLHGLSPLTASTSTGFDACGADLGALVADIASRSGGARAAFIAAPAQATAIRFWAGGQFGVTPANDVLPVAASAALAAGTVICIEPESFACSLSDVRFDMSTSATLHMEDTTPLDIVPAATGTISSPVKNLYQTDTIGLKMSLLGMCWCMRAPHVSYMTGVSW